VFEFKPDYEQTLKRMEAFWEGDLLDRPLVQFRLEKPDEECVPLPDMGERTVTEFWLDAQYQAELALAQLSHLRFLGDTLPIAWANLGPDVFPAFYGCPLHFGDYGTSWSEPILQDWSRAGELGEFLPEKADGDDRRAAGDRARQIHHRHERLA
jgi:hypothetical protein